MVKEAYESTVSVKSLFRLIFKTTERSFQSIPKIFIQWFQISIHKQTLTHTCIDNFEPFVPPPPHELQALLNYTVCGNHNLKSS